MGRQPCCEKVGLKRGPWTLEEDNKLMNFILNNGIQCWRIVPKLAGLTRCGKSCRLRWINYLRPDVKRGAFTKAEEDMIIELHSRLGNRWSKIAAHLPGRTDNEIKNHWNTRIKKTMKLMGLDPLTHMPIEQKAQCSNGESDETHQMELNDGFSPDTTGCHMEPKLEGLPFCGPNQDQLDSSVMCQKVLLNQKSEVESSIKTREQFGSSFVAQQIMVPFGDFSFDPFQNWMDNPFLWDTTFSNFGSTYP